MAAIGGLNDPDQMEEILASGKADVLYMARALLDEIERYVTVHTGCKGLEVRPDGVLCQDKDHQQILIPGTTVICALGQRPRTQTAAALRDCAPFVRVIGDAARVSTITNAVYWGYHAALDI